MFDLIIEKGNVVDGTGSPRFCGDVGVKAGVIAEVGDLSTAPTRTRVDATGLVLSPGFIDVHAHDDFLLLERGNLPHPKLLQGVTTVVVGNCGISLAPLVRENPPPPLNGLGSQAYKFSTFKQYLDAVDDASPVLNAIALVGHSTLRVSHMKAWDAPASSSEIQAMRRSLEESLDQGAWGFSTGLYYPTASAASAAEVVEIGKPLVRRGDPIAMHIRDEGDNIEAALSEAFSIGKLLDVPIVLSHHKLVGIKNHGRSRETLALIEQACRTQRVCLDCYPYDASSTMLLPGRVRQSRDVLVTWSTPEPGAAGMSLFKLAEARKEDPETTARALAPAGAIYFALSDEDVTRILAHPLAMIGSDGLAYDAHPHPRLWGSFPRVLGRYVRERKVLTLEAAVHKMTGLSASQFGIPNRGTIARGNWADLVLFDPERICDQANYEQPTLAPSGIVSVYVNGELSCENGRPTGRRAGRMLRKLK
ncbi:MAG: D-aminoacylase [Burkholderiales bacterium 68-12]|nr:MAG: D-aminoacylase [Burkholderiales bacterium 68-12]